MSIYNVARVGTNANTPQYNSVNAVVVQANSANEARQLGKNTVDGDSDVLWANATPVDLTTIKDMTGWTINTSVNTSIPVNVTTVGVAGNALDDILTAHATALLAAVGTAISGTAHSAYNTSTNLLTVASIADGIGNKTVTTVVTPPAGLFESSYTWAQADLVTGKVDGGSSGAVLTVQYSTTWVIPGVVIIAKE